MACMQRLGVVGEDGREFWGVGQQQISRPTMRHQLPIHACLGACTEQASNLLGPVAPVRRLRCLPECRTDGTPEDRGESPDRTPSRLPPDVPSVSAKQRVAAVA